MQDRQQYTEVLQGWRAFVEAAGIAKSRIKSGDVHEHQHIRLSRNGLEESDQGFSFALSQAQAATLSSRFTHVDEHGKRQPEPLQLGFPLLRVIEGQKAFFVPLFRYSLPDTWCGATTPSFIVPVKQGNEVAPNLEAFRQYLNVDIQELGAERHMMSIAAACMEQAQADFAALFEAFLRWIKQRLNEVSESAGKPVGASLETAFTGIVCPQVNADFSSREQLKDYSELLKAGERPVSALLERYISYRCDDRASSPTSSRRTPYGLFERKYPLGRGQTLALAQIAGGAALSAVQGAPGTGKTTLFKSLIASQLVERALHCIEGEDRNLGLVVTSTAKKAVENVIDDLRGDPALQGLNWLYFQGGDSAQVTQELQRVGALLEQLDSQAHDPDEQDALAATIVATRSAIDTELGRFHALHAQYQAAAAALDGVSAETYESRLKALGREVSEQCAALDISVERGADIARQCSDARERLAARRTRHSQAGQWLATGYGQLPSAPFSLALYARWLSCPLSANVQHHFVEYPIRGLARLLAIWFGGRYRAAREHLRQAHAEDFRQFDLDALQPAQLAVLARNRRGMMATAGAEQWLDAAADIETDADRDRAKALQRLAADVAHLTAGVDHLRHYKTARHALVQAFPEGDWLDVLRLRFIAEQRRLFDCAIDYLWQELLRQKALVSQALSLWTSLLSGKQDSGFYRWKDKLDEFYRLITLAYPLMASTLVSIHKLAGYKLADLDGFAPYHLSLVDEAGMISVEALVPLLARSQRAVVVGDPLQIEPIRSLDNASAERLKARHFHDNTRYEAVSPMLVTAYHRAAGTATGSVDEVGDGIVLDEHRRCQPAIAELFMRIAEYRGVHVCTAAPDARIAAACAGMGGFNLMFYGVPGRRGTLPNTNEDEVDAIGLLLDKLEAAGYDLTQDVGIITPYANQKNLLIKRYGERLKHRQALKIGSVHQFQGVGFEVIVYSPVIFQRTDRDAFQNGKPNLLNVAVSRAKQQFIVVGNQQRLLAAGKSLARMAERCAASFFVEMEHQSPSFEGADRHGVKHYFDCDHIPAFEALAASSQRSFTVVVPWIRQGSSPNHPPLKILRATQQRGVAVTVYYGHDRVDKADADDGDAGLIEAYRRYLGEANVVRMPEGTHEKILLVDDCAATVGSWNWLSHGYYRYCESPEWQSLALRRETSVELRDPDFIARLKERLMAG